MSIPASGQGPAPSSLNLRGAVDLSALKRPQQPAGNAPGTAAPAGQDGNGARVPYIVDVNQESFSSLVQLSAQVPVIVELTAGYSDLAQQLSAVFRTVADDTSSPAAATRMEEGTGSPDAMYSRTSAASTRFERSLFSISTRVARLLSDYT